MPPKPDSESTPSLKSIADEASEEARHNSDTSLIDGRYQVESELGRGGMGAVLLAEDQKAGMGNRKVAIKRILNASERGIQRFLRESATIAQLNHENIRAMYDLGQDNEGHFLVMEYIDGETLLDLIKRDGVLDDQKFVNIVKGLAKGLACAHRKGIIHRDVKPANVLLNDDGTPKLTDFGLARGEDSDSLSLEGVGLGTAGYAPPEQRRDASSVDHRADIFGLGASMYFLLTGRSPQTVREAKIPDRWRRMVMKCMEERPEDRFYSMDDFLDALTAGISSQVQSEVVVQSSSSTYQCSSCQYPNNETAKFCRQCGDGMFEDCPKCGHEERRGTVHCPNCGVNIRTWKDSDERIANARTLMAKKEYAGAMSEALQGLKIADREELREIRDSAKEHEAAVSSARKQALKLEKSGQFKEAETAWRELSAFIPQKREAIEAINRIRESQRVVRFNNRVEGFYEAIENEEIQSAASLLKQINSLSSHKESEEVKKCATELVKGQKKLISALIKEHEEALGCLDIEEAEACIEEIKIYGGNPELLNDLQEKTHKAISLNSRKRFQRRAFKFVASIIVLCGGAFGYHNWSNTINLENLTNAGLKEIPSFQWNPLWNEIQHHHKKLNGLWYEANKSNDWINFDRELQNNFNSSTEFSHLGDKQLNELISQARDKRLQSLKANLPSIVYLSKEKSISDRFKNEYQIRSISIANETDLSIQFAGWTSEYGQEWKWGFAPSNDDIGSPISFSEGDTFEHEMALDNLEVVGIKYDNKGLNPSADSWSNHGDKLSFNSKFDPFSNSKVTAGNLSDDHKLEIKYIDLAGFEQSLTRVVTVSANRLDDSETALKNGKFKLAHELIKNDIKTEECNKEYINLANKIAEGWAGHAENTLSVDTVSNLDSDFNYFEPYFATVTINQMRIAKLKREIEFTLYELEFGQPRSDWLRNWSPNEGKYILDSSLKMIGATVDESTKWAPIYLDDSASRIQPTSLGIPVSDSFEFITFYLIPGSNKDNTDPFYIAKSLISGDQFGNNSNGAKPLLNVSFEKIKSWCKGKNFSLASTNDYHHALGDTKDIDATSPATVGRKSVTLFKLNDWRDLHGDDLYHSELTSDESNDGFITLSFSDKDVIAKGLRSGTNKGEKNTGFRPTIRIDVELKRPSVVPNASVYIGPQEVETTFEFDEDVVRLDNGKEVGRWGKTQVVKWKPDDPIFNSKPKEFKCTFTFQDRHGNQCTASTSAFFKSDLIKEATAVKEPVKKPTSAPVISLPVVIPPLAVPPSKGEEFAANFLKEFIIVNKKLGTPNILDDKKCANQIRHTKTGINFALIKGNKYSFYIAKEPIRIKDWKSYHPHGTDAEGENNDGFAVKLKQKDIQAWCENFNFQAPNKHELILAYSNLEKADVSFRSNMFDLFADKDGLNFGWNPSRQEERANKRSFFQKEGHENVTFRPIIRLQR